MCVLRSTPITDVIPSLRPPPGFNTNGALKSSLMSSAHWYSWTEEPEHGLYVLG